LTVIVLVRNRYQAFRYWEKQSQFFADEISDRCAIDTWYEKHEPREIGVSEYFAHLRRVLALEGSDEDIALGSQLELRKIEPAAFDAVAEAIGSSSRAILFFHDTIENVKRAHAAELRAVHVRTPANVKQGLVGIRAL